MAKLKPPTEGPMTKEQTEKQEALRKAFDELRALEDELDAKYARSGEIIYYHYFNEMNYRTGEYDMVPHPVVFRNGKMVRVDGA